MTPCCVYGCMATKGITQLKSTGAYYCEKHHPNGTMKASGSQAPKQTAK